MSQLTIAQVGSVLAQIIGVCMFIVLLSYPIQKFATYCSNEWGHKPQQVAVEVPQARSESLFSIPLPRFLGGAKPANTLVPPPPPMSY